MRNDLIKTDHATRLKLLEISATIFAESGFRKATVREICSRAGTNIAAIHYHFGNKQALYQEALQFAYSRAKAEYPPVLSGHDEATVSQQLYVFLRSFLQRVFHGGKVSEQARLMMREMLEPTPALRMIVEKELFPMRMHLEGLLRQLSKDSLDEEEMRWTVMAVVGQVTIFHQIFPSLQLLWPEMHLTVEQLDRAAQFLTRYTLAALQGLDKIPPVKPIYTEDEPGVQGHS